jgi:hypothetical protein
MNRSKKPIKGNNGRGRNVNNRRTNRNRQGYTLTSYPRQGASMVAQSARLISASCRVHLRYNDVTLNRLAGSSLPFDVFSIRMNDVWDPDPAILTNQPTGFNEYAAFYNQYRVWGATVRWTVASRATIPVTVFFLASKVLTTPSAIAGAIDLAGNSLAVAPKIVLPTTSSLNRVQFRRHFSSSQVFGSYPQYLANETTSGTAGASPTSPTTFLYLIFIAYSNATWNASMYSNLVIDYDVEFFGRRQLVT